MKPEHSDYYVWLSEIKQKIRFAQLKVGVAANKALLELYWELGKEIVDKQKTAAWGDGVIDSLTRDLKVEFPSINGFSRRNLYAIRQWYIFYSERFSIVPQPVAQIPWGHNRLIIGKIKDVDIALFYAEAAIKNGWSRDTLEIRMEQRLYERTGKAITNFEDALPSPQSDLARETVKDPYHFDFLGLEEDAQEREIENALMKHLTGFLLELGKGFAFVGRQYKIEISATDYFIDLLFYHLDLRCYVVVELKAGRFKPEYAGKLNFYLSAVDSQIKRAEDNPTIGILLCRKKDKIEAEYALRDINKPIGISDYLLTQAIPGELKGKLPTVAELENDLAQILNKKDQV